MAIAPIFVLILMGGIARWRHLVPDAFWAPAEKLTYYLFFPALLAQSTATASLGGLPIVPMAAALIGAVLTVAALTLLVRPLTSIGSTAFTSVFQGSIRPNTYIAIALVIALWGPDGLAVLSIALICVVPLVNLLSVLILARASGGTGAEGSNALKMIASNPIILGILLGVALNLSGIGLPPTIGPLMEILGRAALPVGLLAVGAGLDLTALRGQMRSAVLGTAVKLLVMPAVTVLACRIAGLDGLTFAVCILYGAVPCSASSHVLARQMGGDAALMAGIITATTLAAMVTIPALLILLA
jgi:predicted permease